MSDTLHLACVQCKKELWVGQYNSRQAYLYSTDEDRDKFDRFYREHRGHDIRLVNMGGLDTLDLLDDQCEFK